MVKKIKKELGILNILGTFVGYMIMYITGLYV